MSLERRILFSFYLAVVAMLNSQLRLSWILAPHPRSPLPERGEGREHAKVVSCNHCSDQYVAFAHFSLSCAPHLLPVSPAAKNPPSIARTCPVMKLEDSDARKIAA